MTNAMTEFDQYVSVLAGTVQENPDEIEDRKHLERVREQIPILKHVTYSVVKTDPAGGEDAARAFLEKPLPRYGSGAPPASC